MRANGEASSASKGDSRSSFITIAFDNGTEFHSYKEIETQTAVTCFFATPYHAWERGSNENTTGLIRQYLPKHSCMKNISQTDYDRIAYRLNTRPRKRHCYKTPEELYYGKDTSLHLLLEPKSSGCWIIPAAEPSRLTAVASFRLQSPDTAASLLPIIMGLSLSSVL